MVQQILQTTDTTLHGTMIDTLVGSEPFSLYADEIRKAYAEGKIV